MAGLHEARDDGAGRARAGDRRRGRRRRARGEGSRRREVPQRGQVCISPTRFLVHNASATNSRALVKHAEGLKVGNGLEEGTTLGALANPRRLTAMASVIDNARKVGASIKPAASGSARKATSSRRP